MNVNYVLAVVSVSDIPTAEAWYQKLFGRPRDNNPMPTLVEWQVTETGWVQVHHDPERAGTALLNLAVDDLAAHRAELADRGLAADPVQPVNKGVQLSSLTDPDGNRITLIGNFRVDY